MLAVAIYVKDTYTLEYNRIDLFDDEKISVTSSIQNINDISKVTTDYSQTFTVPASKQNNMIFRHWYENSNDNPFSTLLKSDAYIEIDTILFRTGKIQLESANLDNGQPKDYSITFIGILGSLKDKFAGLYLKDLTDTTYDFIYNANFVKNKVTTLTASSPATPNIAFPLITSQRYWNYGLNNANDIGSTNGPIRYNELFPAIKISAVFNMIENEFGVNFNGTFLSDARFTNAYLWLKNSELFTPNFYVQFLDFNTIIGGSQGYVINNTTNFFQFASYTYSAGPYYYERNVSIMLTSAAGTVLSFVIYEDGISVLQTNITTTGGQQIFKIFNEYGTTNPTSASNKKYTIGVQSNKSISLNVTVLFNLLIYNFVNEIVDEWETYTNVTTLSLISKVSINTQFPEIKVEDFFSGILKMFNLTCFSNGDNDYTIEQLENYYLAGSDVDLTQYIIQDKKVLNRVKTYKKINFEYTKSESAINVAFNSVNGVEYGSLLYTTNNDGGEYNIKLPFEDLNFQNLKELLQVGYALKSDTITKYIPKPIILYEYTPNSLVTLTASADFYFNTATSGGTSTLHNTYRAFGQEYFDGTNTFSLNFNQQQSTLTNVVITNGLYDQYYKAYFNNIFNFKARLVKVSAILPTSILTSLKLNDNVIIRDAKYIINTMNIDLTSGVVQFELLTDQRQ